MQNFNHIVQGKHFKLVFEWRGEMEGAFFNGKLPSRKQ